MQIVNSQQNNSSIYEASHGNAIRNDDSKIILTPQGETNLDAKKSENIEVTAQEQQAQKDAQRETATGYLAHKSRQSQVEIYLAVATNGRYESNSDSTADIISELRDVQKQNNAVDAYATYKESQL